MIAVQLMSPDDLQQPSKTSTAAIAQSHPLAGDRPASVNAPFQPLDPEILSETIPTFFIGRNGQGFWIARDVKGRFGGIFLLKSSALAFARRRSWPEGCATVFTPERIELDLENSGNRLIPYLEPSVRMARRTLQRIIRL
jgi:hypothetical protein